MIALVVVVQMHESDIMEDLEAMCDPDTDGGDWINFLDLQEEGTKLNVVPMGKASDLPTLPVFVALFTVSCALSVKTLTPNRGTLG